ncbi:16S rRNA processing protein RimM [Ehrlichia chaffeensis str. Heartland]|uniref:Ribosome maturation factor RimM n=1 Tax=Ehrlichia chaffeensis (strain ATCC CRL-10679 / Arkansas) TaxID=205920 RepID=RIMM_EHRCR|nr:ribosome maturation factor RimM [Ehrlichia chaffeensis]Q2GI96.1 RecName: Full=Ribosome maturation factor RimM [Ehrlichia chaffeensis str. Arkansas]ABD45431.1 16S rRNA processing protein RimM [Ehrlichia chaffeensis str. Arkansas]AHX03207.1 16S rRNA processing protein RimM [Ehrlichia chaffeensis str. Heartland]AHX05123.1 16S rRNA processing protein RimM [Ehrlichia chaffeensis str. Jax]AHX06112.1 16S rRNA processing protein RimM [Ehrlichia chaffeensis str. Liberty]AHX07352.1 16S rRNA processi
MENDLICLGVITSSHGISGHVKIKTFTENPEDFTSYGTLTDGINTYEVEIISIISQNIIIAQIKGIVSRTDADLLRNKKFFVEKNKLPNPTNDDEFYYSDLIGLNVVLENNNVYGNIKKIHNFGSCDIIEIRLSNSKKSTMLPFTKDIFPYVNVKEKYIIITLPEVIGNNSDIQR